MKKAYYLHFQGRQSIGVSKKMDMQIEEFRKFYDIEEIEIKAMKRSLVKRVLGLFPTASIAWDYEGALAMMDHPAFVYVRRAVADRAYVGFWKRVKEKYPDCKIIIEIFTYPYDWADFAKWNAWPFYIKERLYRLRLKQYVDRFVTYTDDKEIFGVPTICTYNGVNVESVSKISGKFVEGQIHLIGVAFMQRQHGYERIIEGLRQYYDTGGESGYRVCLHLVGEGPERPRYQRLVHKYGLEAYVHFYPTIQGEELDRLYDQCDMALMAFGMYKVHFYGRMGALKSRECLAKGMPLLSGCAIDVLPEDYPYARMFPNDDSVVRTKDIVDFYREIKSMESDKGRLAETIRQFAREHVSMETVMKPIIEYIS
ncbi:MAG: glycosyltransferase [Lachnospiraceae bacterium]|nr:glycosyltransferase [Lachnospiraceae bacterium]